MLFFHQTRIVLLLLICNSSAYPHSWLEENPRTQPPGNIRRSDSLALNLLSDNQSVSSSSDRIHCYEPKPHGYKTSVDGCRPTLNYFRTFPNYRQQQMFLEGWYPKEPSKPPYAIHHSSSNCAVKISSFNPRTASKFSFADVRSLATNIIADCEPVNGGIGGIGIIGVENVWTVSVIGMDELPPSVEPSNSTAVNADDT